MYILLPFLLSASTVGPGDDARDAIAPRAISSLQACTMPEGWSGIADREPRFVVFGETHGTQEAPALVANVACGLAAAGERVLLAIELSVEDNAALQAAWRLPVDRFPPALRNAGWAGRQDGVASRAMFDMLAKLHARKEAGVVIDVTAFNGARDAAQRARFATLAGQGPHESSQAENIADAASAGNYDRVIVLVGSFHARRNSVSVGSSQFEPMAMRLAKIGSTISLRMRDAGGSMWNCIAKPGTSLGQGQPITADAIDCRVHSVRGSTDLARTPFMRLGPFPGEELRAQDFDGFVWLGPVTGSPPLMPGE